MTKPTQKPNRPFFSSGPCAKRPGWSVAALSGAWTGRSHRATGGKTKLAEVIDRSRAILGIPDDYRIGIVPASDTGAVEMALWSLLGARGTDMLVWESFGKGWATDVSKQLKLEDVRILEADYGELPDLTQVDFARDAVFTWNGTTSGVCVPNGDWIAAEPARGRAAGKLQPGVAAAQNFPADQGRQADRGDIQGRDHQHPLDALCRRRHRFVEMGGGNRWTAETDPTVEEQPGGGFGLGREDALG
jgi:hypothetical protein